MFSGAVLAQPNPLYTEESSVSSCRLRRPDQDQTSGIEHWLCDCKAWCEPRYGWASQKKSVSPKPDSALSWGKLPQNPWFLSMGSAFRFTYDIRLTHPPGDNAAPFDSILRLDPGTHCSRGSAWQASHRECIQVTSRGQPQPILHTEDTEEALPANIWFYEW